MVSTRAQSRQHATATATQRHGIHKKSSDNVTRKAAAARQAATLPPIPVNLGSRDEIRSQDHGQTPDPTGHEGRPLYLMPHPPTHFGLIQERLPSSDSPGTATHIYCLLVQSILWNQTRGKMARPVLEEILRRFPAPAILAQASESDLEALLQPIGLWRQRAKRLIKLGQTWLDKPPCAARTYQKKGYPLKGAKDGEQAWEVAHLPGVGPYALDAFRIFCRDGMRKISGSTIIAGEEEWRTVLPTDKDLRAYLIWRWRMNGWHWDYLTGSRTPAEDSNK